MKKFFLVFALVCMCLLLWSSQNVSAYTWVDRGWTDPISMPKMLGGISYNDYAWLDAGGGWSTILFYNTDGDSGCTPYHNLYLGYGAWSNYGVYGSCHWLRMDCNPAFSHCTSDDYSSGISSNEVWGGSFLGFTHSTRDVMKSKADLGDYTPYGISDQVYQARDRNGAVQLSINIEPLEGGNVTGSGISCNVDTSSMCQYYVSRTSQVAITANPSSGWSFAYWTDGANNYSENPHTVTMDDNKYVKAVFKLLSFPLAGYNAYNAPVSSVFDHSGNASYSDTEDHQVAAFNGEASNSQTAYSGTTCYPKTDNSAFGLGFTYTGYGQAGVNYLCYNGHPGFDYAVGTAESGVNVYSAASGTVVAAGYDSCMGNYVEIQHTGGYTTKYLHLRSIDTNNVQASCPIGSGVLIGISGDTGTCSSGQHLHFQVEKSGIPVDPYGWAGGGPDPYTRATNINLWK